LEGKKNGRQTFGGKKRILLRKVGFGEYARGGEKRGGESDWAGGGKKSPSNPLSTRWGKRQVGFATEKKGKKGGGGGTGGENLVSRGRRGRRA